MTQSEHHVVLISGAASGIGLRTAERFLERGDEVHICDLSQEAVSDRRQTRWGRLGPLYPGKPVRHVLHDQACHTDAVIETEGLSNWLD